MSAASTSTATRRRNASWLFLVVVLVPLLATAALLWVPELRSQAETLLDRVLPVRVKTEIQKLRAGPAPKSEDTAAVAVPELVKSVQPAMAGLVVGATVLPAFALDDDGMFVALRANLQKAQKVSLRQWSPVAVVDGEVRGLDGVTGLALIQSQARTAPLPGSDVEPRTSLGAPLVAVSVSESGPVVLRGIVSAAAADNAGRLKTDLRPRPEDAGAPVFLSDGQWVGILVADGTVLPRGEISHVVSELKERGSVRRPTLGLETQVVRGELAERLAGKLPEGKSEVLMVTASEQAGLFPYDVLLDRGNPLDLESSVTIGDKISFMILRGGKKESVQAEVLDRNPPAHDQVVAGLNVEWLGATSSPGSSGESGRVRIQAVEPGSKYERGGLVAGDVILDVDKVAIRNLGQMESLLKIKGSHTARVRRPEWAVKAGEYPTQIVFIRD